MAIRVSGLYVYPVKGCRGISLEGAIVGPQGILGDREFMVVDERGMFVAQRGDGTMGVEVRSMCRIETRTFGGMLFCSAPDMPELQIYLQGPLRPERVNVQIWRSSCSAIDEGTRAAKWFTSYLSRERPGQYRLVRMPAGNVRTTKDGASSLGFADGYPFLVISQASLDDLNTRLEVPLPMNRFRPNVVLDGCTPYEEDALDTLRFKDLVLMGGSKCERCAVTTTDQLTGERGKEPLRTLATYRRETVLGSDGKTRNGVMFGRNYSHVRPGTIRIGDSAEAETYYQE